MRIGVDGYPLAAPLTGVGRYLRDLLRAMIAVDPSVRIVAPQFRRRFVSPIPLDEPAIAQRWPAVANSVYRVLDRVGMTLPFDVLTGQVDAQLFTTYATFPTRRPTATFIYDLTAFRHHDTLHPALKRRLTSKIEHSVETSGIVLTISETVATEIRERFPSARVEVVLPGPTTDLPSDPPSDWRQRLERLGVEPGYVLFVGTLEPRKNLGLLLDAMNLRPGMRAVLVGASGWENPTFRSRLEQSSNVTSVGFVADPDLRSLYEGASCLVMPSLYEGFGLPILEAMSTGTPVVCTRIPVFTEVAADAAEYFENDDPRALAEAVERALEEPHSMAARGRQRLAAFSWHASALKVLSLLGELTSP